MVPASFDSEREFVVETALVWDPRLGVLDTDTVAVSPSDGDPIVLDSEGVRPRADFVRRRVSDADPEDEADTVTDDVTLTLFEPVTTEETLVD